MPSLTLADVLGIPALRRSGPVVLTGQEHLSRQVRWVHAAEVADIASYLRPGDLVLSTGIALPSDEDTAGLADFASSLAEAESAGLLVELGRRWQPGLPTALVKACTDAGLPLVALTSEVQFASVVQAVGELIVDQQLNELRDSERVHETFTELSFSSAGPAEILAAVQRLAGSAVVLENEKFLALDYLPGHTDVAGFLDGWQARSSRVRISGRTGWDERNGWLVAGLGPRERGWGRLIIEAPTEPNQRLVAVAERAAAALALHRLYDRERGSSMRRTHHELIRALQRDPGTDVRRRCELAGFPVGRRQFVGLAIRASGDGVQARAGMENVVTSVLRAADELEIPSLVSEADHGVQALLSLPTAVPVDLLVERFAERLARHHHIVVGAGRTVAVSSSIDRTLREAQQVADAVGTDEAARPVHRLEDVHLRGLLALLRADERLHLFVDRELEALRQHDTQHAGDLVATVRALVQHPSSKSDAARSMHLSRAAFYARLDKVERVLGVDLENPDIRVSLHVALLADELVDRMD